MQLFVQAQGKFAREHGLSTEASYVAACDFMTAYWQRKRSDALTAFQGEYVDGEFTGAGYNEYFSFASLCETLELIARTMGGQR